MEFHRPALELFGRPDLPLDGECGAAATRVAAAAGIALPVAVAEWYCVPESSPAWRAFTRHDGCLFGPGKGEPTAAWFGRPVRDEATPSWWSVPAVCHDPRGWLPDPILPLMGECVGTWWWGVVLDGTADPRAVITHNEGETWDVCGPSFSAYVYAILFDAAFDGPDGCGREVRLEGHHLYGPIRDQLREQFRVEPAGREPCSHESEVTERYSRESQRVSVCNLRTPLACHWRPDSRWRLWAADRGAFDDLVGRLSRIVPAFAGLIPMRDPLTITAAKVEEPEREAGFWF